METDLWLGDRTGYNHNAGFRLVLGSGAFKELKSVLPGIENTGGYTDNVRVPLWEGFFGILEGPQIVPYKTKTERADADGVILERRRSSRWFGLTGRRSGEDAELRGGGVSTLAVLAYAAKADESGTLLAPAVSFYYTGVTDIGEMQPLGDPASYVEVQNPFGVSTTNMRIALVNTDTPDVPMLSSECMSSVSTETTLVDLPTSLDLQDEVLAGAVNGYSSVDLAQLIYGGTDLDLLAEVWNHAMTQKRASGAAEVIVRSLG